MKRITTLSYKGQEYIVVDLEVINEFGYTFGTVDKKFIENGRLTKQLNGLQLMLGKSVEEAINNRKFNIDYKEMIEAGMSIEEVAKMMMDRR